MREREANETEKRRMKRGEELPTGVLSLFSRMGEKANMKNVFYAGCIGTKRGSD